MFFTFLSYLDKDHLCNMTHLQLTKKNYLTHGRYKCNIAMTGRAILNMFEKYEHIHVY